MNIETKTVRVYTSDYACFGWQCTGDTMVRQGKTSHNEKILARDKDMPHYRLIVALETRYFNLKSQKKVYEPMEIEYVLLTLVLFVVPFIIYYAYKKNQKQRILEHNQELQRGMNEVLEEAKRYV